MAVQPGSRNPGTKIVPEVNDVRREPVFTAFGPSWEGAGISHACVASISSGW
jgi:hypothetical protein